MKIKGNTLVIALKNAAVVDQFQIPGGAGQNLGIAGVPATVSFNITYTKSGTPRNVQPTSSDPLSPFAWAGEMWTATNSGTFSLAYNDGSFSASGSFSSSGNFGEMGTEQNGSFATDRLAAAGLLLPLSRSNSTSLAGGQGTDSATQPAASPALKGKVPVKYLVH